MRKAPDSVLTRINIEGSSEAPQWTLTRLAPLSAIAGRIRGASLQMTECRS
jgi:hypothetical protein